MTLILLEAGVDTELVDDGAANFAERATGWKWQKVLDWLKAHDGRG